MQIGKPFYKSGRMVLFEAPRINYFMRFLLVSQFGSLTPETNDS
jgi:hypothetical protein